MSPSLRTAVFTLRLIAECRGSLREDRRLCLMALERIDAVSVEELAELRQ